MNRLMWIPFSGILLLGTLLQLSTADAAKVHKPVNNNHATSEDAPVSPTQFSPADVSQDGTIKDASQIVIQNCVAKGIVDDIMSTGRYDASQLCLSGFTQILPRTNYNVLGISPSTSFDELGRSLNCYGGGGTYPPGQLQLGEVRVRCFGNVDGTELYYVVRLLISGKYKRFTAVDPEFQVCGPELLVKDGETYLALKQKYGTPLDMGISGLTPIRSESKDVIRELYFVSGGSKIKVETDRAENQLYLLPKFHCPFVLEFHVTEAKNSADFGQSISVMDNAANSQVKAKF